MEARKLQAKEISCRVQQITADGLSLLLYITSRAAMNLMDDTYGKLMWKRESKEVNGEERCIVSVYNKEIHEWITRDDVGTASYTEKEKGRASDAFKRACVNFGIGRELYSAPRIWITNAQAKIQKKKDKDVYYTYDRFAVKSITYNNRGEIDSLEIINLSRDKEVVFKQFPTIRITKPMLITIQDAIKEIGDFNDFSVDKIYDMCSISDLKEMSVNDYESVYNKLIKMIDMKKRGCDE